LRLAPAAFTVPAMAKRLPDDLRKIAERLQVNPGFGRGRRSQLYRWMLVRANDLERMLADLQPSWSSLADALAEAGLRDGTGNPPNAERCRKTWHAVNAERTRRAQVRAAGSTAARQSGPLATAGAAQRPAPVIRPVRPVAASPSPAAAEGPTQTGSDDLQRVLSEMGARDKKIPDPLT
jgi:hypothetical protein